MTSVSPSAMIATELIERSTEPPMLGLATFGLMTMKMSATTMMAANRPPIRSAMSSVALPAADIEERGAAAWAVSRIASSRPRAE